MLGALSTRNPGLPTLFARHVKRPRLTRALDNTGAQVILLNAPAGYGKTALAAEWLQEAEHVAWYRATGASADVAAASVGIADAVNHFMPNAGDRLRRRVQMGDAPQNIVPALGELMAEDLEEWPAGAWLVIDDYHLLMPSKAAEEFVDWLLALTPIRLLVTTRQHPTWATTRRLLAGDIFELTKDQLAMTKAEASELLSGRPPASIRALVEKAEGWPAFLGLATLALSAELPEASVADVIFRYLAEEVLLSEPEDVQMFMVAAALPSTFDAIFARDVTRISNAAGMLSHLSSRGLIQGAPEALAFHPLLREFLRSRADSVLSRAEIEDIQRRSLDYATRREHWDDALRLAGSLGQQMLGDLLERASSTFLRTGRLELLSAWLAELGTDIERRPMLLLSKGSMLTRLGRFREAALVAQHVASLGDSAFESAAHVLAGQAYYFLSDPRRALESLEMAKLETLPATETKDALWRRFSAARELNLPELSTYLADFNYSAGLGVDDRLRMASGQASLAFQGGTYAGLWQTLSPLLRESLDEADPLISSGALVNFCYVAIGRGDYATALALVERVLALCERHRLEFAAGFCTAVKAHAELGLGHFARCHDLIAELILISSRHEDPYLAVEARILTARLAISKGRFERLAPIESWEPTDSEPFSIYLAHYLGLCSLAAAASGNSRDATSLSERALEMARTIETVATVEWTFVLRALADGKTTGPQCAVDALRAQHQREFLDSFVLVTRAVPAIIPLVASDPIAAGFARQALKRCEQLGGSDDQYERPFRLTKRELEVWSLISDGCTNAEIARRLCISHSTAKVHVHNILKKLGASNRLEAALAFSSRR